jgi:phenylacetate-CoA ligase
MRRADYRALIESHEPVVPTEHGKVTPYSTSGSSGVPVNFWRSEMALRINANHYWADHQRQGRDLTQRMAVISGYIEPHVGTHNIATGEPWLHPGQQLCRLVTAFTMDEHALWLCSHPVNYVATTPASLSGILSAMGQMRLEAPQVLQILTSAYSIEPELRKRARDAFGASIRDRYSCEEVGPIAFQCPESDDFYHCAVSNVVVEVVDTQGVPVADGAQGNVLVTGLHQWASPAIRYELGDIASWHTRCPACHASVPALSNLLGRKHFLLKRRDGQWHHIRILADEWLACAPLREYRLVQKDASSFRAELVLDRPITNDESVAVRAMLARLVGPEFSFELVQLEAIPWPPGRKRQEFVGLLP